MKTEKAAEAFAAETMSARLFSRLSRLPFLSLLPQAALLCALLALGAAAPLSQTRAQAVTALQLQQVLPAAVDVSDGSANVTLIISADAVSGQTATVSLSVMDVTESIGSGALPASRFSFVPAQVTLPVSASIQRHEVVLTYDSGTADEGGLTESTHVLELTVTAVGASPDTGELTLADVDAITENLPFAILYSALRHRLRFTGSAPYEGGEMFTVTVEWEWTRVNDEDFKNLLRANPAKAQAAVDEIIAHQESADPSPSLVNIPFAAQGYVYRLEWSGDISLQSDPQANNSDFMNGRGTEGAQNSGANYFEISVPQAATAPATCVADDDVCEGQAGRLVDLVFTVDADAQGKAFFYPTNAVFTQPAAGDQDLINALTLLSEQVTDVQLAPAPAVEMPTLQLQLTAVGDLSISEGGDAALARVSFTGELPAGETLRVTLSVLDNHDIDSDPDLTLSTLNVELTSTAPAREVDITATDDSQPEEREVVRINATGRATGANVTPAGLDVTVGWNDYVVEALTLTPPMVTLGETFQAEVTLNALAPAGSNALEVMLIARHSGTAADETTTVRVVERTSAGASRDWELEPVGTWTLEVISDPLPRFETSVDGVDASTAMVTAQAQDLQVAEPAPVIMRENLELFAPGTGAGSGASARHTQADIWTYGTLAAEDNALQLVFRFTDADGNTDMALMPDEITVDRVEIRSEPNRFAGDVLTLASNPVVSLTSSPGYFVLTADRVTGGGEEDSDPRGTTLTVTVAGETFVGFATGFVTDVISNALVDADENMPAYFEPDPLLAGETAHLRLRYRVLGCVDPANPTADSCEPDKNNDLAVDTGELNVSCSGNNCGLPVFMPPLNPSREVSLVRSDTDGSFYSVDIRFTAPAPNDPTIATQFTAAWNPGAEGGSATNSPLMTDTASRMASAALVQDMVSPTPHAAGLSITEAQPYQISFAWSTATDKVADAGAAEELSDPSAYSIFYAGRGPGGVCPTDPAEYEAVDAPARAAVGGGFTAVAGDTFDGSEKIQSDTAYCFILEVDDGVTTEVRTMPADRITASFLITLDADDDGLPDHLAPVCSVCDSVTNPAADDDGDGINNVLEAYLAEESGVSSGAPGDDRDAYSDTDSNDIPDILDLQYGAFDDRTAVPSVPSNRRLTCHAEEREVADPQTFCAGAPSGSQLLIEMDAADGDGVYQGHDGATLGALDSGTHWLLGGGQLARLDIRPRVTLSEPPASIEASEEEAAIAQFEYELSATVAGLYPLGGNFSLQYLTDSSSEVPVASITGERIISDDETTDLNITLNFNPALTKGMHNRREVKFIIAVAGDASISNRSFESGSTTRLLTVSSQVVFPGTEEVTMTLRTADTSVLIPSMHDEENERAEIFAFTLTDAGEDRLEWLPENIEFELRGADTTLRALRGFLFDEEGDPVMGYSGVDTSATPAPQFIVSHNNLGMATSFRDGASDSFYLRVWLDPNARVADGSTFTVSIDSEGVTLAAGDDRSAIVPNQMLSSGEIRVEVQPDQLLITEIFPVYTYNRPAGVSSAVRLSFTLWDEHGNRDLNTPVDELELISLQTNGNELSFDAADVQIVSTEPGTFTLTITRVTGGGAEGGNRRLNLEVQREYDDSDGGTVQQDLEGTVSGFTVNVVANTLADPQNANMRSDFAASMLRPGERESLHIRYRILGCATAGDLGSCQPETNDNVAVTVQNLRFTCTVTAGELPCTAPTPDQTSFSLMREGGLLAAEVMFTVPDTGSALFMADWELMSSLTAHEQATVEASRMIIGDTVPPVPPPAGAGPGSFRVTDTQPYQIEFHWGAAMDQRTAGAASTSLVSVSNYRLFYAEPVSGNCPGANDTAYGEATNATITPATADPAADGFTAVAGDTFDSSEKIKANTAYCFALEVADNVNSVRTDPISAMTAEYSFVDAKDADGADGADGLPDALAPVCGACRGVAEKTGDEDNDGINNVLEAYLAEDAGVDAARSGAHSDANNNNIPDILELHYGAIDDRTAVPPVPSNRRFTCHASAWQTRATFCEGVIAGMRLLIEMNSEGEGVYTGGGRAHEDSHDGSLGEGVPADANTLLGSGTHWLMDADRQLLRLDVLPLLALSGPAEVAVTPGARASAGYSAEARLQGPPALSDDEFALEFQARPPAHQGASVDPAEAFEITRAARVQQLSVTLPALTDDNNGDVLSLTAVPVDANAATMSLSRRSFDDTTTAVSLRPWLSAVRLLDSTPAARPHAIIPYLVDAGKMGTPRIGSVTLPEAGDDASWAVDAEPDLDDVRFACVEVPGVLADPAEGTLPGGVFGHLAGFTIAAADRTDPDPDDSPAPAHAHFYDTDTLTHADGTTSELTVADCGSSEAADHLLGQLKFLVFPAGSGDEDRDGNLVPDSEEGGPRGSAGDSGAAGLRYEVADGTAYYLRSPGPGRGLRLGEDAADQGFGTPNLIESDTVSPAQLTPPIPDILTVTDNLVLDFEAYCADSPNCMQAGALVRFVFQVSVDIPSDVQYYKRTDTGWCPINADYADNPLPPLPSASLGCPETHEAGLRDGLGFAAPDADGVCPPIGSAEYAPAGGPGPYLDVPQAGDRCVQLSITNGGSNDNERSRRVSSIIGASGFLGVERGGGGDPEIEIYTDGYGGGGGSVGLPALLLLGLLTLLSVCGMLGMRRAGFSASRALPAVGCALLLALAPVSAQAQEPAWLPDAVSAAAGATFLDPDTASAFEVDDDEDSGWRLGVEWLWRDGVQLLPALPDSDLFVELSYADLGEATVCLDTGCTDDSEHEVEYEIWSLGVRSVWDWSHELAPWLGKPFAGVGYRYGRSNEDMGEKNGAYWNAGFEWELGWTAAERGFSLRVFYEAYDADAGAVWAGLAWHPRTERRVAAEKPRRPRVERERVERRPAERRRAPTLMDGQCPVSVEDACACLEPVGRSPAGWYVQVIAYSQRAQAQQMRDRLAREGLRRLGLRTLSGSRGVVHAVRVASPRSCSAAMEIKKRVDRMLEVNALVRPWYQSPW